MAACAGSSSTAARIRYELSDVSAQHPEVTEPLAAALQLALDAQRSKGSALHGGKAPATTPPDPALLEQLRALGYVEP